MDDQSHVDISDNTCGPSFGVLPKTKKNNITKSGTQVAIGSAKHVEEDDKLIFLSH